MRRVPALLLVAAVWAGCGDEPSAPEREPTATGADLRVSVAVRERRDGTWRRRATIAPGDTVAVRLEVANTGARQAGGLRGGVRAPVSLTPVLGTAAEWKVSTPSTGRPVGGAPFVRADLPLRPLSPADQAEYRVRFRATDRARGKLTVRGRVAGAGVQAGDTATVRVRR